MLVSGGQKDMTKADLVEKVTGLGDLTRRDGEVIVETIFGSVIGALQSGDKIEIRGFGSFRIRQRNSRIGRNPKTANAWKSRQACSLLQTLQRTPRPGQPRRSQSLLKACAESRASKGHDRGAGAASGSGSSRVPQTVDNKRWAFQLAEKLALLKDL